MGARRDTYIGSPNISVGGSFRVCVGVGPSLVICGRSTGFSSSSDRGGFIFKAVRGFQVSASAGTVINVRGGFNTGRVCLDGRVDKIDV